MNCHPAYQNNEMTYCLLGEYETISFRGPPDAITICSKWWKDVFTPQNPLQLRQYDLVGPENSF